MAELAKSINKASPMKSPKIRTLKLSLKRPRNKQSPVTLGHKEKYPFLQSHPESQLPVETDR